MAQQLDRILEANFLRGYNDRDKPEALRVSDTKVWMADIVNAFIEENKIIKRGGYSQIGNAPESKAILGQERHEPYGGSKYILRARNNSGDSNSVVEGWSGSGNWSTLTSATSQTAGSKHNFFTAESATYILTEDNDTVLKTTNGTSASTVSGAPAGIDGAWFHNYAFIFGTSANPDRLYFSDLGDPDTWDTGNQYIDVNPGDNEPIQKLAVLNDQLLIFKASRVWALTGFGTADFTVDDLGERVTKVGTVAPGSVVETGNDVYYLSYRGQTPHFRSVRRTNDGSIVDGGVISDVITGTMDRLTTSQLSKVDGEFDGRRVWWAVPTDTSTTNNEVLVFDTLTQGWTRMTGINASVIHLSTISGSAQLYFGSSESDGKSHHLDGGGDDDGDAIDFQVKTPFYYPAPGHKCKFKYLYITADSSQDVDLDVDYSLDGFTFNDLATVSLTGLGAAFGYAIWGVSKFGSTTLSKERLDDAGGTGYYMQYRYRNNESNEDVTLREWELFYYPRGLRAA